MLLEVKTVAIMCRGKADWWEYLEDCTGPLDSNPQRLVRGQRRNSAKALLGLRLQLEGVRKK